MRRMLLESVKLLFCLNLLLSILSMTEEMNSRESGIDTLCTQLDTLW